MASTLAGSTTGLTSSLGGSDAGLGGATAGDGSTVLGGSGVVDGFLTGLQYQNKSKYNQSQIFDINSDMLNQTYICEITGATRAVVGGGGPTKGLGGIEVFF